MDQKIINALSLEIGNASKSLWNGDLSDCEEGISLDTLWDILNKYVKPEQKVETTADEEPKDLWGFVTKYYPDYDHANEIAWEGDLSKLVDGEYEEGDCAHQLLISEYDGNIENPKIKTDHDAAIREIYEAAIGGYIESLKK